VRRLSLSVLAAAAAASTLLPSPTSAQAAPEWRAIRFPTAGPVSFTDDFGAPRSGGRSHKGNDLFGPKLTPLMSTVNGQVVRVGFDTGRSLSGNFLVIRDAGAYEYKYIHINNDTPGTDDGANPAAWRFAPGIRAGTFVAVGQHIGYMGDSGNAETTPPHLHFEIGRPNRTALNPWLSLANARDKPKGTRCRWSQNPAAAPSSKSADGYWAFGPDGGVYAFGGARFFGSAATSRLPHPVVAMAATPTGDGYWLVTRGGGVHAFGDATVLPQTGGGPIAVSILGMAPTPTGLGYWLVGADGSVFTFGDALHRGSMAGKPLNKPIVGMESTVTGLGYWLVASDGGLFAFGDAAFHGSTGSIRLNEPITGMAAVPGGSGYWLVAADGGLFAFGRGTRYFGSVPGTGNCGPVRAVDIAPSLTGRGYWIQSDDGRTWAFGDARNDGDLWRLGLQPRTGGLAPAPIPLLPQPEPEPVPDDGLVPIWD